jgi:membrane-associated phospholipid phosphatase
VKAFTPAARRAPAFPGLALLWWGVAGAALGLGAMFACRGSTCGSPPFDRELLGVLHAWRQPWLDGLMATVTWFGSIAVLLPIALALAWHYWRASNRAAAILLPLSIGGAWLIAHATKLLAARPRPDLYPPLVDMPADLSFPSAHTMQATAFALAWMLAPVLRRTPAIIAAVALLVALVALSRLYLQVHFPSDVMAGVIAGAGWVAGLHLIIKGRP